ncbi:MAG: hypothetical protein KIT02_05710 [Devosia sp.]|uniref:hypothetical protein n=1 Tax=Devosia sp. TaxID=1871048 RepID=UPI0024CB8DF4|nr:hypothetical protein [Devosia sp.]UYO00709.1 MAG: hypothetical protein KIT02_05710 [Devosia sp.]
MQALTIADLDRDYDAIMASADDIRAANPGSRWPDGLTKDDNLIDLAWHQREFRARRSFSWVIENASGDYLGCLYVYPSISGEAAARVAWWWHTGHGGSDAELRVLLTNWLSGADWPRLDYRLQEP